MYCKGMTTQLYVRLSPTITHSVVSWWALRMDDKGGSVSSIPAGLTIGKRKSFHPKRYNRGEEAVQRMDPH